MKNIYSKILVFAIFGICAAYTTLHAQTFEEYQKKERENFYKFVEQEQLYIEKMAKERDAYINKQESEYKEYLKKEWESYTTFAAKNRVTKPKPIVMPKYSQAKVVSPKETLLPAIASALKPTPTEIQKIVSPVMKSIDNSLDRANLRINYYGVPLYLNYDPSFEIAVNQVNEEKGVAAYWASASATKYSSLLDQLLVYKENMNLNDYCYYLLVKKVAQYIYPGNEPGEILSTWFLMVRSGYGMRIGFDSNNNLLLLLPSYNTLYGTIFLQEGQKFLYIMNNSSGKSIRTYNNDFLSASKLIDFNIASPINLGGNLSSKNLEFVYKNKRYNILTNYDAGLVQLFKDYPQLEMPIYFNAAVSMQAKESIAASLKPIISQMGEQEAVNFLLSFTQNAFKYKTDEEQFGQEKFFFPEELLFYPYCDCEDRSVFFSYLVRDLVGLDVLGLEFPNHMATAVSFSSDIAGDHVKYKNARYVMADPTYLGAPVGQTMPEFIGSSPILIPMENIRGLDQIESALWSSVQKGGCYPGSNLRNMVSLNDGSSVLTGFYTGNSSFFGKSLPSADKINRGFIGRVWAGAVQSGGVGNTQSALWVLPMESSGNSVGISVTVDSENNIYLAGSFRGSLSLGGKTIKSSQESADAFIACINNTGTVKWITRLNLDTIPGEIPVAFSATFSTNGQNLGLTQTIAPTGFKGYGIFTGDNTNMSNASATNSANSKPTQVVVYNGIMNRVFSATPNIAKAEYASAAIVATPEMLKSETEALVLKDTDKGIAGLFAAMLMVKNMNATLSGNDAKAALDKFNPNFSKTCPNIYKNFALINFVKNSNGVISIQTNKEKDIYFAQIRVKNNANINVIQKSDGNLTVEILNGMQVGKLVVWFKLNSIELIKKNGDMVFDYDKDHSTTKINMTKDILL